MAARCNCDDCTPDPAFTCSYTGKDESVALVYVANAYRGNLILCPGGANGAIGGLLQQLDPPQHYSHMGIMVADYDLVRHTTAVPSRLSAEEYYTGSILGVSAPVDGLNVNHVQFGWPGSITQSAEQIFFADTYGDLTPPGLMAPYHGSDLVDMESPSGKSYRVAALSFQSASDDGKTWYPALVVKPCPLLESADVNQALNRVADEALTLFAHYRFYCYTKGFIGDIPDFFGPAAAMTDALPKRDPSTQKWMDWSDPSKVNWTKKSTIPAVCFRSYGRRCKRPTNPDSPRSCLTGLSRRLTLWETVAASAKERYRPIGWEIPRLPERLTVCTNMTKPPALQLRSGLMTHSRTKYTKV
jgi:hypothetical protein